ncbi:MAG: acyl carrier protein, partial [Clostridia bacterium]|nr:acyl carrier protein [Clostridia bacterium]
MERILELVASVMKKDVEFLKANLDTENLWNSLTRVEILLTIEEEFDIFFDDDDIKRIKTINQLV